MFVVVTMAMLLLAALPRFGRTLERLQTERIAFDTAQLLRYAQATAVMRRQVIQCAFDEPTRRLRLGVKQQDTVIPLQERFAASKPIPPTVRMSLHGNEPPEEELEFFPNGTSEGGTITVAREAQTVYTITVDTATGRTSVLARPAPR